ncbi:DUF6117 family protein [Hoeflea alexandrii]|uniref:DUF6117 family protein n=1 Tax=Hoeflea alexandrii TaxID=288436 RepID=UPI0022AEB13A|nr:DUF6117 family protein [Hoeflea alexandrii]MCZ4288430.1 DUF6117 family protein [Hoeflea alexandrii]
MNSTTPGLRTGRFSCPECVDVATDTARDVIGAVGRDGEAFVFTPFCHLAEGNPYEAYVPPEP